MSTTPRRGSAPTLAAPANTTIPRNTSASTLRTLLPSEEGSVWAPTIFTVKGVLVGAANTGKTNIIERLVNGRFNPARVSTETYDISETYVEIGYKGLAGQIQLWDTAGQERQRHLAPLFYQNAYICFIVYSITDRASFEAVSWWWRQCKDANPPCNEAFVNSRPNVALVGNKLDMDHLREVSTAEGTELARSLGIPYFFEQSSIQLQQANTFDYTLVALMHRVMCIKTVEAVKKRRITEEEDRTKKSILLPPQTTPAPIIKLGVTPTKQAEAMATGTDSNDTSCFC